MSLWVKLIGIILGFAIIYPLQNYIDSKKPPEEIVDTYLYVNSGKTIKTLSFGFDGFMADIYWLRSVQYFGRQILTEDNEMDFSRAPQIHYELLYPLLDITTTLDPHYIEPYRFGGIFLPDYNSELAVKLLQKGIDNNPTNWKLYQSLGTLYWQKKDYQKASDAFIKGGEQPESPAWLKVIGGIMLSQGGRRNTACQLYSQMYDEAVNSKEDYTRAIMYSQIQRIYALDEVDYINNLIQRYKELTSKCPETLTAIIPLINSTNATGSCGQPIKPNIDPQGTIISPLGKAYIFDKDNCKLKDSLELYEP